MNLRSYQDECVGSVFQEWKEARSTLVSIATGLGKTVIAAEIIRRVQPARAIFVCHREELVWQARNTIMAVTGLEVGVEMAELQIRENLFGASPVVVATVQTLNSNFKERTRMSKFPPSEFGVLIADEVHHGVSNTWKNVFHYFQQNPNLKIVGLTATADRCDEESLGQILDTVAFDFDIRDAIHDGWLVPVDQQFVHIEGLDFSEMRTTAGDLNGADLAAVMEAERNLQEVTGATISIIGNRRAIVFTASVKQAETTCNIFNRHRSGMAEWVYAGTPKDNRKELLSKFQQGDTQVICNCGILTEGFDDPGVEVIVMARPTKSRSLYAQMAGRSTRPLPGIVDGLATADERKTAIFESAKKSCLIVDFVGNSGRHKLMSCIAEGQLVLTDHGLVPIEHVTSSMMVWDGLTYVPNTGSVSRGNKKVINYAGLEATDDHEVWTKKGWQTFGKCASEQIPICVTGNGWQKIRETDGYFRGGFSSDEAGTAEAIPYDSLLLWDNILKGLFEHYGWRSRMSNVCLEKMCSTVAAKTLHGGKNEMHQPEQFRVSQLWRARNPVPIRSSARYGTVDYAQSWAAPGVVHRQDRQRRRLRGWEPAMVNTSNANQQQPQNFSRARDARLPNCLPGFQNVRWALGKTAQTWSDLGRDSYPAPGLRTIQRTARVFDITNAGPRHRFTVQGLLVSNCADILGGKVSDAALERAVERAKKLGKPVRMSEALDEAEEQIQELAEQRRKYDELRKARVVAKVSYTTRFVNPFDALDLSPVKERGWDSGRTLSEKQRALLLKQGIDPDSLPYAQARQVIGELFKRWNNGSCSIKQAQVLKRYGYETKELSRDKASALLDALAKNRWKKPVEVPAPDSVPF